MKQMKQMENKWKTNETNEDRFINSGFRSKFEDKGRFVSYLQPIPVYLVIRSNLGLLGAAKKLQQI